MKSVMISIKPKYCELIASGKKTVEVRKTKPKLNTPFKCYIYCTKSELLTKSHYNGKIYVASSKKYQNALERNGNITLSGKVIGEFVCDNIFSMSITYSDPNNRIAAREFPYTCLTDKQIMDYLGNGKRGYGWHISDLKIYDEPKELDDFTRLRKTKFGYEPVKFERPPQSWCYMEA